MTASHGKALERQTEGWKDEEWIGKRERHCADVRERIKEGRIRNEEKKKACLK